ncbi:MAG TPA: ABC transporter ATP-binding protein [Lacunisphaera sp.]|nr:ABC transporter ATP-binding protein [Lacunisphaera sp.]
MTEPVITVDDLGKRYFLSHETRHETLRDSLTAAARRLGRAFRGQATPPRGGEEFWALRGVSFEVGRGEVVGIVGRNGAGKSTLLKILSRITEPTAGRARIRGRIASLLEVGTGFHPELTGRENIFLNGAILGMSRAEIQRKFDEIVAFAEVERFLDTQVKHYSSGMYVRLAFAVAAHLEPEILIVDEVLAVGDLEFQKKCLGRMNAVSKSGRTVLFVSHNLEALRAICQTGILLESGRIQASGPIHEVITRYHSPMSALVVEFPARDKPTITRIAIDPQRLAAGDLAVAVSFRAPQPLKPAVAGIVVSGFDGRPLFGTNMRTHPPVATLAAAAGVCLLEIPQLPLHSGSFSISAWLGDNAQDYDARLEAVSFTFVSPRHYPNRPPLHVIGPVDLACRWTTQPQP